jgi:stress response protein YsnF
MKTEQPKQEKDYTALLQPVGTKQETLEEVAKNYLKGWGEYDDKKAFIAGAKWQQEQDKKMYSYEEMLDITKQAYGMGRSNYTIKAFNKWFEQFKNK